MRCSGARGTSDPGEEGSGQHQLVSSRLDWRDWGRCGRKGCEEERRVTDDGGGEVRASAVAPGSRASGARLRGVKDETRLALAASWNMHLISACKSKKPEATGRCTRHKSNLH